MINSTSSHQKPSRSSTPGNGAAAWHQEQITRLLAFFSRFDQASPENVCMCTQLGDRYLAENQVLLAKLIYRLTLEIDPDNPDLKRKLARITRKEAGRLTN
jgi:cytochrome c-type biogenesis protein CcmH/NrfG